MDTLDLSYPVCTVFQDVWFESPKCFNGSAIFLLLLRIFIIYYILYSLHLHPLPTWQKDLQTTATRHPAEHNLKHKKPPTCSSPFSDLEKYLDWATFYCLRTIYKRSKLYCKRKMKEIPSMYRTCIENKISRWWHGMMYNMIWYSKSTLIPTSYTSPARPPYIHKKNKKQFSQKYVQKTIISRINFIQTFPTNYSTKLSRFFLCLLDTMCLVHPHFLTVHLQTSHSISIWLYAFL